METTVSLERGNAAKEARPVSEDPCREFPLPPATGSAPLLSLQSGPHSIHHYFPETPAYGGGSQGIRCKELRFCKVQCVFLPFPGPLPRHMEVPTPWVQSELRPPAYTRATATRDPSQVCSQHHSSWSLIH